MDTLINQEAAASRAVPVTTIELKKSILADNDRDADALREETKADRISYMNVMSSPGSGKTTTILAMLDAVGDRLRCGVMEADIDSDVDAKTIQAAGYPSVQLHTGGMCHLDAQMSRQGLQAIRKEAQTSSREQEAVMQEAQTSRPGNSAVPPAGAGVSPRLDLVILENVGNLVCPAEFDTGADINVVILSVPEGDDKPLKYPLVFTKCDAVIINKIDSMPAFDFDMEKCEAGIRLRNPDIRIFPVSAKTGEGIPDLADWVVEKVKGRI